MKEVAKVIIIDEKGQYLLLRLNDHPRFHNDPDLPGGTVDGGEEAILAAIREVYEETMIQLNPDHVQHLSTDSTYSAHGTVYHLYMCRVQARPAVTLSWEHESYQWLSKKEFLSAACIAADTYMHMVYDMVSRLNLKP